MLFVGLLTWWYSAGLLQAIERVKAYLASVYDYFSIDLLLRSLFAPFRQISAGSVDGPINVKLHAFFDRLFSRLIGAFMRTMLILIGIAWLLIVTVFGGAYVIGWLLMPIVPLVGMVLAMIGYAPWR